MADLDFDFAEEMMTIEVECQDESGDRPNTMDVYMRLSTARNHPKFDIAYPTAELAFVNAGMIYAMPTIPFKELRRLAKWINEVAKHYQEIEQ